MPLILASVVLPSLASPSPLQDSCGAARHSFEAGRAGQQQGQWHPRVAEPRPPFQASRLQGDQLTVPRADQRGDGWRVSIWGCACLAPCSPSTLHPPRTTVVSGNGPARTGLGDTWRTVDPPPPPPDWELQGRAQTPLHPQRTPQGWDSGIYVPVGEPHRVGSCPLAFLPVAKGVLGPSLCKSGATRKGPRSPGLHPTEPTAGVAQPMPALV